MVCQSCSGNDDKLIDLRRCQSIECQQKQDKPEDGVRCLDREFLCREEQRKQRDVTRHGKWPKGSKVSAVLEREEAERDDDQQNGFFMYVPAEQERRVTAERESPDKGIPRWLQEELDQRRLLELTKMLYSRAVCSLTD